MEIYWEGRNCHSSPTLQAFVSFSSATRKVSGDKVNVQVENFIELFFSFYVKGEEYNAVKVCRMSAFCRQAFSPYRQSIACTVCFLFIFDLLLFYEMQAGERNE